MTKAAWQSEVTVIGGSSPLGHHLLSRLAAETAGPLRVLTRRQGLLATHEARGRIIEIHGDLQQPETLAPALVRGGTVINLAVVVPFGGSAAEAAAREDHGLAMANLARACAAAGVARLVHCSSVSIVGGSRALHVDEDTPCEPETPYERAKLADEQALEREARGHFPLAILRPGAIFGRGLASLVAPLASLLTGRRSVNYLRSSLFGRRRTHLVCAENAAAALVWLARRDQAAGIERYIVSEDDCPENNFRDVERLLLAAIDRPDYYPVPPLPLPRALLHASLMLTGRRTPDVTRIYDGSRLMAAGFRRVVALPEAVTRFAQEYRAQALAARAASEARIPIA